MNYDQIVVSIIDRGKELLSLNLRSNDRGRGINHDIEQLRILWQKIMLRSQEKRNKLEDALNQVTLLSSCDTCDIYIPIHDLQADGFNDNLNQFVGWLTNMEKELSNTEPGSRIVDNIEQQIINHTVNNNNILYPLKLYIIKYNFYNYVIYNIFMNLIFLFEKYLEI